MLFGIIKRTAKWISDVIGLFYGWIISIVSGRTERSEFIEKESNIIDGVCYMSLEQSRELKYKMKKDIKIAHETVKKAEALINGRIGDQRNCFLFNSSMPSNFLHIRNSDKLNINRVEQYSKECSVEEEFDTIISEEEIK